MDAATRAKKARRLLQVQEQLYRAERSTLVRLERELARTESAQNEIAQAIGEGTLRPEHADLAIVRLRSLSREGRRLMRERDKQQETAALHEARRNRVESASRVADLSALRDDEAKSLAEIADRFARDRTTRSA
jgi:hypothetical protein